MTDRVPRWIRQMEKQDAMHKAEAEGKVADSLDVRIALMRRVKAGEITLEQAQAELKKIKRDGKRAGLLTRSQAFSRG